jgi:organic radical activating enzyme
MKQFIAHTCSLCPECYRHLDAEIYEEDGKIKLIKSCKAHGEFVSIVENDPEFYYNLTYNDTNHKFKSVLFEVTNKCNLNCPHCYQLPDNKSVDKPESLIISEIESVNPQYNLDIMFAGAEPTVRKDLPNLITNISLKFNKKISLLTNGVNFSIKNYVDTLINSGLGISRPLIGLNHHTYQGLVVHNKQLKGIDNLNKFDIQPTLGYTVEKTEHLDEIITEAYNLFLQKKTTFIRLRFGSDIGRTPDDPFCTLSDNVKKVKKSAERLGLHFDLLDADNNTYHQMVAINDFPIRVIQWPDVKNIVLDELKMGPWAKFYGGPITNFVHQVIVRDGLINQNRPKLDEVPFRYTVDGYYSE